MVKILMVCLGNICRSPLAEGILKSKLDNIFIDSCGTGNFHIGQSADIRSIKVASNNNIDISKHVVRQLSLNDFDTFDVIYAMDKSNYDNIIKLTNNKEHHKKIKLILCEVPELNIEEVPDPYFGSIKDFEYCYEILDKACQNIKLKYQNN